MKLPDGPNGEPVEVSMADLGIKMPVVVTREKTRPVTYFAEMPDPTGAAPGSRPGMGAEGPAGPGAPGVPGASTTPGAAEPKTFKLRKYRFVVQFGWQPQPRGQRIEKAAKKKAGEASTAAAPAGTEVSPPSS